MSAKATKNKIKKKMKKEIKHEPQDPVSDNSDNDEYPTILDQRPPTLSDGEIDDICGGIIRAMGMDSSSSSEESDYISNSSFSTESCDSNFEYTLDSFGSTIGSCDCEDCSSCDSYCSCESSQSDSSASSSSGGSSNQTDSSSSSSEDFDVDK